MTQEMDKVLYDSVKQLELSEAELRRFCYPRPHSQSKKCQLFNINKSYNNVMPGPLTRTCKRCGKVYHIDKHGHHIIQETCAHHWGKLSRTLSPYYYCCKRPRYSEPCTTAEHHVTEEIDPDNLTGYIHTGRDSSVNTIGIYALDCEMVYTTDGMDVAAISVVDWKRRLVYETLVKPDAPIVDYNTKLSGLTEQQFRKVTTQLHDVHKKLLTLFGSHSILVGHGLDHDLMRLKVIHDHVVDTSILYPHPKGLPIRNSLSFLKERHLGLGKTSNFAYKCRGDAEATMMLVLAKRNKGRRQYNC
ncbi:exonuclease GOR-like [Homarus americanus]|uniref:RNA exonuclease 1-like 4 n=1 Tax=Homarus americanus TaxID=6706 RepID=A0A8J5KB08_HOMAM|nr:exonuclease GOR-like [Homarus americanus]KAG7169964.1 RNA exonuclease 1-like 4 [Homarus americanus]